MSPDLIVTSFGGRFRKWLTLCAEAHDNDMVDVGHLVIGLGFWYILRCWGDGRKEKEVKRLCDVIVSYIAKNIWPYIMRPPIWPRGDWGQSQFQLGGDDESTHQILSYGLLFSTFYHFPYTADPLTCTMPMWPSTTFAQSPSIIPYTHRTIGLVPHQRPPIWPTDHVVIFSFLSLFSVTWHILSWPNQSQVIAPCNQDFTIHFAAHEPCAHFTYCLYLRLLYLLWNKKEVFPQSSDLSLFHLIVLPCSISHLHPTSHLWCTLHYCTILNFHLTPLCTPWYYIRRPFHCSQITPFRTT